MNVLAVQGNYAYACDPSKDMMSILTRTGDYERSIPPWTPKPTDLSCEQFVEMIMARKSDDEIFNALWWPNES